MTLTRVIDCDSSRVIAKKCDSSRVTSFLNVTPDTKNRDSSQVIDSSHDITENQAAESTYRN